MKKKWREKLHIFMSHPELLKEEYVEAEVLSGACLFAGKDKFRAIDGYDPNTFLYNEENILYKRFSAIGLKSYVLTHYRLIHLGASSTKKSPSLSIMKAGIDSGRYYVRMYSGANVFQRGIHLIVTEMFIPKFKLKTFLYDTVYKGMIKNKAQ